MITGKTSVRGLLDLVHDRNDLNLYSDHEQNNEALMQKVGDEFIKILTTEPLVFFHKNENLTDQRDFDLADLKDHISHISDSWKINFFQLLDNKQAQQIEIDFVAIYSNQSDDSGIESVKIIGFLNTLNVPGKNTWKPDFEWVENRLINLTSTAILKFMDNIPKKSFFGYLFSNNTKRNIRSYGKGLNYFASPSHIDLSDKRFHRVLDYTVRCPLCNAIHHIYLSRHRTHKKFIENNALFTQCKSTKEILTIDGDRIYLRCGHSGHKYSNKADFSIGAKKYKIDTKQMSDEDYDKVYLFIRSLYTYQSENVFLHQLNEGETVEVEHSKYFDYIEKSDAKQ